MITVRSLMQDDVTPVRPEMPVRELARLFRSRAITGAPVVDEGGHLLGVVSTSDIVRLVAEGSGPASLGARPSEGRRDPPPVGQRDPDDDVDEEDATLLLPDLGVHVLDEVLSVDDTLEDVSVADAMTSVSFTLSPDATVRELAEFLVRGRIHRALVQEEGRLVGIVTTFDVLRAVAEGRTELVER